MDAPDDEEIKAQARRLVESGLKKHIMVCCVTFETVKAADPVRYYKCDKVHVIHYVKDPGDGHTVYQQFYDRVVELLRQDNPDVEVVEVNRNVTKFDEMLAAVTGIIEREQALYGEGCEIYVNISSGSPEYSAAAAIASMMAEGVTPFSVGSREYSVGDDEGIRRTYYGPAGEPDLSRRKPVGLTSATYEPRRMPVYAIPKPQEHLVRALRVLERTQGQGHRSKSTDIVPVLKEEGLWLRDDTPSGRKQSEAVRYRRDFTEKWMKLGWVEKDEYTSRLKITTKGERILKTFYVPDPPKGEGK